MFGWTRIATLAAIAAMLAMATGVAGATSKPGGVSGAGSHLTRAGKITGSTATRAALLKAANLRTRAGAARYLRSIGLKASHLVIQRGIRNYAGANCPGKSWSCTSTAHPVVQIAAAGGFNTFECSTASCAVVQVAAPTAKPSPNPNTASCIKTTGLNQSCSISQTGGGTNTAVVYENAGKLTGLMQTASQTAFITQRATGTNTNTACVTQAVNIDGSTNLSGKKGAAINVALEAHQGLTISQSSDANGTNTAVNGATASGTCDLDSNSTTYVLNQAQTLNSTVTGTGSITQNENAANNGANMTLDITQNQNDGTGLFGPNTATFNQTNSLTAIANGPATVSLPLSQTQSSVNGGILAAVNQSGPGVSTASATQQETQCGDAAASGLTSCSTTEYASPGLASLAQTQYGPIRKTPGDSSQTGNSNDSFTVTQNSRQDSDSGSTQSNVVEGGYSTDGTGSVTQTTTVDGQTTTNHQSGQNVTTNITCTGTTCAKPLKPPFSIVGNNAAFGGGPIQTYDVNTGALVNSFVPDGATIDSNNGRAVLVVGNEVFYTELCCGGFGATDFIRVAPFNGGAGGADIRTLPNPSSSGVQDLAFAGGALYALTGYSEGPLQVFKLDPTNGAVLGGPVPIAGSGQEASADGFAILPNGNFLINLSDESCTYNQYDPTTGTATGVTLTVPSATFCTGVATDGTSLFFQTDFNSFTQTDLAGAFIAKTAVQGNSVEGISLVGS